MSLELLISKYIDGELSQSEDNALRNLLKENPYAREKFDNSVELHIDLLQDSTSINVPANLLKRTEEAVMMKIFAAPAFVQMPAKKYNYFKYTAAAVFIIMLSVLSILKIDESDYPRTIDIYSDNSNNSFKERIIIDNSKALVTNSRSVDLQSEISNSDISDVNIEIDLPESYISDELQLNSDISRDLITNQQDLDISLNNTFANVMPTSNNGTVMMMRQNDSKLANNDVFNEMSRFNMPMTNYGISNELATISLNTYMSRDFARVGLATHSNTSITSMSQSIGYALKNKSMFGIEFGVTELSYDYSKMMPINSGTYQGASSGFEINEPTESNGGNGSNMFYVPVRLEMQESLLWGMAFYDAEIFNYNHITLNGRIGVGGTSDGPLGLGRFVLKYDVLTNLTLTAGAEGKIFTLNTPLLVDRKTTITSFGLVYGLEFNF
ncbi:MAG: hypothetical protein RBT61_09340 [Candidatus Kapabacteria bacterium]|jgi:hypothetical protein|nr:hypothetical protein [Candidatus Kapabacteria bacterium]